MQNGWEMAKSNKIFLIYLVGTKQKGGFGVWFGDTKKSWGF
jgi:hypothetical protein